MLNLQEQLIAGFEDVEKDFEAAITSGLPDEDFPEEKDFREVLTSRQNMVNYVAEQTRSEIADFESMMFPDFVQSHYALASLPMARPPAQTGKRKRCGRRNQQHRSQRARRAYRNSETSSSARSDTSSAAVSSTSSSPQT